MPRRSPRPPSVLADHVDGLIAGWARERPDLDTSGLAVVYRLTRIAAVWNAEIERVFAAHGLTSTDFAVIANLRRAGAPYRLNQREMMTALRLTSGTVSLRLEKMAERGLVTRSPDPHDTRASIVTLTDAGRQVFDRVAPEHLANETRLLAALPDGERGALAAALRTILVDIEQPSQARPDHRLGFVATSATDAARKRSELGLPPQHGLLVESVAADGAAARAGIRPGDTLVRAGASALHSLSCLERALQVPSGRVRMAVLRDGTTSSVELAVDR